MSLSRLGRGVFLSALLVSEMIAGVLADSTADFSSVQGAKNWYYGYFPGGNVNAFTQLPTYSASSQWWQHPTFGPPWTLVGSNSSMHPNGLNDATEEWATREWVSTYAGPVTVTGNIAKSNTNPLSTGVYGRVYWNHQLIYQQFIAGSDGVGVNYSIPLTLKAGDILDFAIAPNGNDSYDGTSFSATVSSLYDNVSVDFGTPLTVKAALGQLNGFDYNNPPGPNPSNSLIASLQPRFWRGQTNIYQRVRSIAPTIPIELILDIGEPVGNYNGLGPPWQNLPAYQQALAAELSPFVPLPANTIWEPWNEPDDGWAAWATPGSAGYQEFWNGTAAQFYQTYLAAFQTIRGTLGTSAQVAGPSFAVYDHNGIQAFLEYCLANGCEVNSLTWHELNDAQSVDSLVSDVQDARASFLQNPRYAPLKIQRIDVNEIDGSVFTHQPAGTLAYYSALEASGADAGARSCWTLSSGLNECFNSSIGGLLTGDTLQPRSVWWAHKSYADGVAGRVQSSQPQAPDPNLVVLASGTITGSSTPQILIGNFNFQNSYANTANPATVNLSLANLQALPGVGRATAVDLRVELIPDTEMAALDQIQLIGDNNVAISGGALQFTLPPLPIGDVYRVTLNPLASQLSFTTPPANGFKGSPISPVVVQVQDANGNVAAGAGASVTLTSSPAAISATVNAVNGVATFSGLTFGAPGTYTLTAASTGLASAASNPFAIAAPNSVFLSGQVTASGVGLGGVTVNVSGSQTSSTATGVSGSYATSLANGGSYTVSAALPGYSFSPPVNLSNVNTNQTVNFTGIAAAVNSVSPSAGSGNSQVFTFNYSSPNGASYLSDLYAIFGSSTGTATSCYIQYHAATNALLLYPDAGTLPQLGPLTPGASGTLSNSQCALAGLGSSITTSGNSVTLKLNVMFPAARSPVNIYGAVLTINAMNSGFFALGTWTPAAAPAGLRFVPITPCRLADTRTAAGPFGAPSLAGQATRNFTVPSSACNIPVTAQAYSLNVTVVPPASLGYLTVWPTGLAQPIVSTLNSDGRVKSNAAIVPAGTAGAISVFASNATDVILDINGYFVSSTVSTSLAFYPVVPCRVSDTRLIAGSFGGPYISGQATRTIPIQSSACGVPSSAQAYSLNLTSVPRGPLGYLTVWPSGQNMPATSSLNAGTGTVTANAAIVLGGTAGSFNVFASNDTDLAIDINGYFAPPGSVGALSLYNVTPCRALDTRISGTQQPFSGTMTMNPATSVCGVSTAAQAYVFSATTVPPATLGYLTMWAQGAAQPVVSTLNAIDGAVTGNMAIVPANSNAISAFASNTTHLILDIFGYFAP